MDIKLEELLPLSETKDDILNNKELINHDLEMDELNIKDDNEQIENIKEELDISEESTDLDCQQPFEFVPCSVSKQESGSSGIKNAVNQEDVLIPKKDSETHLCLICNSNFSRMTNLKEHKKTNIKNNNFYTLDEKIYYKKQGRPMPDIFLNNKTVSCGRNVVRRFNNKIYSKNNWICACKKENALFCFPCVLFGGETSWAGLGVTDLHHLCERIKKHETSTQHLFNQMELAVLSTVNVKTQLDSAYWTNIKHFNENVTKNRYVLLKIIDCIKFCGVFELALRDYEEFETTGNPGLINFSADFNKALKEHLEYATNEIQSDILDCMLEVCQDTILTEIKQSSNLAVIVDETTDVSSVCQRVIIFRYCLNGEPIERFWTYLVPKKQNALSLTQDILTVLEPILKNYSNKLIAQCYDGIAVMSGWYTGVQERIKEKYPYAHFVHCYSHQINLILLTAASANSQVRVFFGNVQEIPDFFKNAPKHIAVLDKIVKRKKSLRVPTCWEFNINVLFEYREYLIDCMEEIEETFENQTVCGAASSIWRWFHDSIFVFWLTFFHHVMPYIDTLHSQLQKTKIDPLEIDENINIFEKNINTIRDSVDDIIEKALNLCNVSSPPKRKRKNNEINHHEVAIEVCDAIIKCAKDRFSFKQHLSAASMLYSEQFPQYRRKFPEVKLNSTCATYPNLNKKALKNELSVIYSRLDCAHIKAVIPFLKFLIENNLSEAFTETKKLLEKLITIPMITDETERCFSTIKRIKIFLRNTRREEHLNVLLMLSIEKQLVDEIPNFNDKVIDKFILKKNRKIDLIYKK